MMNHYFCLCVTCVYNVCVQCVCKMCVCGCCAFDDDCGDCGDDCSSSSEFDDDEVVL